MGYYFFEGAVFAFSECFVFYYFSCFLLLYLQSLLIDREGHCQPIILIGWRKNEIFFNLDFLQRSSKCHFSKFASLALWKCRRLIFLFPSDYICTPVYLLQQYISSISLLKVIHFYVFCKYKICLFCAQVGLTITTPAGCKVQTVCQKKLTIRPIRF